MEIQHLPSTSFFEHHLSALGEIPDPPKELWFAGTLPPPDSKKLAVVGSRAMTPYGKESCEFLISGLSGYPVSIVSGLALGLDAHAHRSALAAGLHTVAIPGSGLHERVLAPRTNLALAHDIVAKSGALLSEHPPNTAARTYFFPARNRLMAGIADAVLVIEARAESGTLITARLAGEYGKELLCVPHRIGDHTGHAAETFIRIGATLVTSPAHILEALGISTHPSIKPIPLPELSFTETLLLSLLTEPTEKDTLLRASNLPIGEALGALLTLELKGLIEERFGAIRPTERLLSRSKT